MNTPSNAPNAPALDFADLAAIRAWVDDVAMNADDLAAAAEDQTARISERQLGRGKAREIIGDSHRILVQLVALARAGLDRAMTTEAR
jgi:hypothetical protein